MANGFIFQNYPDLLIRDIWVDWSEQFLNRAHGSQHTVPTGIQSVAGHTQDIRSRAVELWRSGVLRGPLVSRAEPTGWYAIQNDQSVHTRFGYLCYAIGKALRDFTPSISIRNAFSCISAILVLQTGFVYDDRYLLTSGIFAHLVKTFVPGSGRALPLQWERYLAAALFCTLDDLSAPAADRLITAYLNDADVEHLLWRTSSETQLLSPDALASAADNHWSFVGLKPEKPSLYWIEPPRGLYRVALEQGSSILEFADTIQRSAVASDAENPFAAVSERAKNQALAGNASVDVLEELDKIFSASPDAHREWKGLMKSLYEGVLDALRYLEEAVLPVVHTYYAHPEFQDAVNDDEITVVLDRSNCNPPPKAGDKVILNTSEYQIQDVVENDQELQLNCRRAS